MDASTAGSSTLIALTPISEDLRRALLVLLPYLSTITDKYVRIDRSRAARIAKPLLATAFALYYAYGPLSAHILKYCTSSIEIRSDDEMYACLAEWLSQQQHVSGTRDFRGSTKPNKRSVPRGWYDYDNEKHKSSQSDDEEEPDYELAEHDFDKYWAQTTARDKSRHVRIQHGNGARYLTFKGRWIRVIGVTIQDDKPSKTEIVRISCLGRSTEPLIALLTEAQRSQSIRDADRTIIFRVSNEGFSWDKVATKPPRPLSSVVLDPTLKTSIVEDIKDYLHPLTKRWYANRGIPYRRGYLLYGPPGTGKTSLCMAIAGIFRLKMYAANLNSPEITESSLGSLFDILPDHCVVLLEDIDSAGIAHRRDKGPNEHKHEDSNPEQTTDLESPATSKGSGISLSGLLNVIDGVASREGHILILTTNHVEKLDPALLRPGRVDLSIPFENANTATAKQLFKSTYVRHEDDLPPLRRGGKVLEYSALRKVNFSDDEIEGLATQFAAQIPSGEFSPAAIQGYLLTHKLSPKDAAEKLPQWIVKAREERARREKRSS